MQDLSKALLKAVAAAGLVAVLSAVLVLVGAILPLWALLIVLIWAGDALAARLPPDARPQA